MKTWNSDSKKGSGCLFSFVIMDREGTEMQVTAFNKACEKNYDLVKENHIYEIKGGYVKINDRKFTSVKSDYKLILDDNSKVEEREDDGSIKEHCFNFVKLDELSKYPVYTTVDVVVYVLSAPDKITKPTKNGEQTMRRIIVADDSSHKIEMTLWRTYADLPISEGQIIACKNIKIGEFQGKNLSSVDDTTILIEPNSKEATDIRYFCTSFKGNYETIGSATGNSDNQSSNKNICYIKEILGSLDNLSDDKIPVSKVKGTVCLINHTERNFYAGCAEVNCKKKLVQEGYKWSCMTCGKDAEKPTYYYTLSLRVKDGSAEQWVDLFGNVGEKIFKVPCEVYKNYIAEGNTEKLNEINSRIEFTSFLFVVKPKLQVYNSIAKKKLNVYSVEEIKLKEESTRLINRLGELLSIKK